MPKRRKKWAPAAPSPSEISVDTDLRDIRRLRNLLRSQSDETIINLDEAIISIPLDVDLVLTYARSLEEACLKLSEYDNVIQKRLDDDDSFVSDFKESTDIQEALRVKINKAHRISEEEKNSKRSREFCQRSHSSRAPSSQPKLKSIFKLPERVLQRAEQARLLEIQRKESNSLSFFPVKEENYKLHSCSLQRANKKKTKIEESSLPNLEKEKTPSIPKISPFSLPQWKEEEIYDIRSTGVLSKNSSRVKCDSNKFNNGDSTEVDSNSTLTKLNVSMEISIADNDAADSTSLPRDGGDELISSKLVDSTSCLFSKQVESSLSLSEEESTPNIKLVNSSSIPINGEPELTSPKFVSSTSCHFSRRVESSLSLSEEELTPKFENENSAFSTISGAFGFVLKQNKNEFLSLKVDSVFSIMFTETIEYFKWADSIFPLMSTEPIKYYFPKSFIYPLVGRFETKNQNYLSSLLPIKGKDDIHRCEINNFTSSYMIEEDMTSSDDKCEITCLKSLELPIGLTRRNQINYRDSYIFPSFGEYESQFYMLCSSSFSNDKSDEFNENQLTGINNFDSIVEKSHCDFHVTSVSVYRVEVLSKKTEPFAFTDTSLSFPYKEERKNLLKVRESTFLKERRNDFLNIERVFSLYLKEDKEFKNFLKHATCLPWYKYFIVPNKQLHTRSGFPLKYLGNIFPYRKRNVYVFSSPVRIDRSLPNLGKWLFSSEVGLTAQTGLTQSYLLIMNDQFFDKFEKEVDLLSLLFATLKVIKISQFEISIYYLRQNGVYIILKRVVHSLHHFFFSHLEERLFRLRVKLGLTSYFSTIKSSQTFVNIVIYHLMTRFMVLFLLKRVVLSLFIKILLPFRERFFSFKTRLGADSELMMFCVLIMIDHFSIKITEVVTDVSPPFVINKCKLSLIEMTFNSRKKRETLSLLEGAFSSLISYFEKGVHCILFYIYYSFLERGHSYSLRRKHKKGLRSFPWIIFVGQVISLILREIFSSLLPDHNSLINPLPFRRDFEVKVLTFPHSQVSHNGTLIFNSYFEVKVLTFPHSRMSYNGTLIFNFLYFEVKVLAFPHSQMSYNGTLIFNSYFEVKVLTFPHSQMSYNETLIFNFYFEVKVLTFPHSRMSYNWISSFQLLFRGEGPHLHSLSHVLSVIFIIFSYFKFSRLPNSRRHLLNIFLSINWRFNPARSSHFGGFFERLIGLTKTHLKRTLQNSLITFEEFNTVLTEVELTLNSRPLTYVDDNLETDEPLTPSHLLMGYSLNSLPIPEEQLEVDPTFNDPQKLSKRYKYLLTLIKKFKDKWEKDYLLNLKQSHFVRGNPKISVGDVVLLGDDGPRLNWKLGIVQLLHTSPDKQVRSVTLRTKSGIVTRGITYLYPLELHSNNFDNQLIVPSDGDQFVASDSRGKGPRRQAYLKANQRLKDLPLDED